MRRAMLFTVGSGEGIENAIAFSADSFNADRIYLLCTTGERGSVHRIGDIRGALAARGLGADLIREPHFEVRDLGDFERTYEDCLEALTAIADDGFATNQIAIDYTTGTKVMSAALVVAAIDFGISHYIYIDGNYRAGEGMRVVTGGEQARATGARRVRGQRDLHLAAGHFNTHQWHAAREVVEAILRDCAGGPVCDHATALRDLARAYSHWDQFEHDEARKILLQMDADQARNIGVDIEPHRQFLFRFEPKAKVDPPKLLWARLADLLNNAERRLAQGRNDDAIQRAYRATELLAQIAFAELDPPIDASGPIPLDQLPEEVQATWACRADAKGQLRLGLTDLYALLLDLDHPLGEWFADDEQQPLRWALTARNQTILAHGFRTARTEDVRTILDCVGAKAAAIKKRVAQWREQATFGRVDIGP
ncbi:MAG: TIGR02710 family CRISPR-associated CARF protein [Armatimonadota bacterium]